MQPQDICSAEFLPKSREFKESLLATGTRAGDILLWTLQAFQCVAQLKAHGPGRSMPGETDQGNEAPAGLRCLKVMLQAGEPKHLLSAGSDGYVLCWARPLPRLPPPPALVGAHLPAPQPMRSCARVAAIREPPAPKPHSCIMCHGCCAGLRRTSRS